MKSSSQELVVVKDNELIENFIFNATELELQILNYAVAVTNPYWEGNDHVYRISIPELVATYKTKSKNAYKVYREALERLQVRTYCYNNGVKEVTENVLRKIIRDTTDNTYLEVCFNDYIARRLNNLKGLFTQYNIKNIAMFSSRYAFMLYEFFKMKLSCSGEKKYTSQPAIHEFKGNLDIAGKYKQTSDLKKIVIEPAKKQINRHSDIRLDYEIIKTGRTPTHIKFTAKYKKDGKPLDESASKPLSQIKKNQPNLPITESSVINKEAGFTSDHKAIGKQRLKELRKKLNIQQ
jgi:plasmid replication initiation protein